MFQIQNGTQHEVQNGNQNTNFSFKIGNSDLTQYRNNKQPI